MMMVMVTTTMMTIMMGRVVAEWLRLLPSDSKVAGSIPVCVPRSDVASLA